MEKVLADLKQAFEDFKKANDEQLAQIRAKGVADPVLVDKVEKLNARIDELNAMKAQLDAVQARVQRPGAGAGMSEEDQARAEYKKAFQGFMRRGASAEAALREASIKAAVNVTTDGEGGYAVPEQLDRDIQSLLMNLNPMRQLARVITVGTSAYKKLVNTRGMGGGWVGETAPRPETATPGLAALTPYMGEVYANPAATQESLDDIFFDVEAWLAEEAGKVFAEHEGNAFTVGNGTGKPKGFLGYTTAATADGVRAFGQIQHVISGHASDFIAATTTASPADCLIDLIQALKKGHRAGAVWQANKATIGKIRKFKDYATGNYIWAPGIAAGQPDTLLGYPVHENEDMPDVGAGALAVAFGNFRNGYYIVDRFGTRVLRDPFTNKPYVHFYTTKRTGGMVADSEAIKVLKIAAA